MEILAGDYKTPGVAEPLVTELNRYRYHREAGDVARKLDTDHHVTLSDVHFEIGSAEITTDSEGALNELVSSKGTS